MIRVSRETIPDEENDTNLIDLRRGNDPLSGSPASSCIWFQLQIKTAYS
jgi:hypothetical protein